MTNVLLGLGCFCVGVVVGVVMEDAWDLLRASRRDNRMWKPRLPNLSEALVSLLLLAVVANIGLGVHLATTRASDREIARINCENANESRAAQLTLWSYVLTASEARQERPLSADERRFREEFRAWIAELFAPRDCEDLDRRYVIPPPPQPTG